MWTPAAAQAKPGLADARAVYDDDDSEGELPGLSARQRRRLQRDAGTGVGTQGAHLYVHSLGTTVWSTFGRMVEMGQPKSVSLAGRLLLVAYGLLILIMVNLFTGAYM